MATRKTNSERHGSSKRRHVPYNLRSHQAKLCEALDSSPDDVGLQSLAVGLYSEGIIDGRTKRAVLRHPGYKGAAMLMDSVDLHVQRDPKIGESVLNIMSRQDCLRDIVQEIPSTSSCSSDDQCDMENSSVSSESRTHKTEEEVIQDAKALKAKFKMVLDKLLGFLERTAVNRMRLQLSLLLKEESALTPEELDEIFDKVDEKTNHDGVISYLERHELLGYLNHRLLDAFTNIINNEVYTPLHHAANNGRTETVKLLLKEGAAKDINTKNWFGKTPLNYAAENGHDSIIEILIQYGATVDEKNKDGYTLLHTAARQGKKKKVELLLKYKANYSIQSEDGDTILHSAAEGGNTEIVELFLKLCGTSDLHKVGSNGYTPLHCAVSRGHMETVELLLKSGANVDGMKECRLTPLHVAADKNYVDIAELLLKAGANVHSKDKYDGRTPLHHAAREGHERIVELLLKYESNINEKDKDGYTLLHWAARQGRKTTVKLLLKYKANYSIQSDNGYTPLHCAVSSGRMETVELLLKSGANVDGMKECRLTPLHVAATINRVDIAELLLKARHVTPCLLKAGAYVHSKDNRDGRTPLHHAAREGHERIVELLLNYGANINEKDESGFTPLHLAVGSRTGVRLSSFDSSPKDTVRMLLLYGAKVNEQDHDGHTPLHHAAREGHESMVELLLKYGANINEKDKSGFTPLHLAVGAGANRWFLLRLHPYSSPEAIVRLLLSNGAKVNEQDHYGRTPLSYAKEEGCQEIVQMLLESGAVPDQPSQMLSSLREPELMLSDLSIAEKYESTKTTPSLHLGKIERLQPDTSIRAARHSVLSIQADVLDKMDIFFKDTIPFTSDKPYLFNWDHVGCRLHIPEGSIGDGEEGMAMIYGIHVGPFEVPQGMKLISAIYYISLSHELLKPATLEVLHCCNTIYDENGECNLTFLTVSDDLTDLKQPYQFSPIDGGQFGSGQEFNQYGLLKCTKFSPYAVAFINWVKYMLGYPVEPLDHKDEGAIQQHKPPPPPLDYAVLYCLIPIDPYTWKIALSLTEYLPTCEKYFLKTERQRSVVVSNTFKKVDLRSGTLIIDVSTEDGEPINWKGTSLKIANKWEIISECHGDTVKLQTSEIKHKLASRVEIFLFWKGMELMDMTTSTFRIHYLGIKEKYNFPVIVPNPSSFQHRPQLSSPGYLEVDQDAVFHYLEGKSSDWEAIGGSFNVPLNTRESLRRDIGLTNGGRLEKVINIWFTTTGSAADLTWERFISILKNKMGFNDVARKVEADLKSGTI